MARSSRPGSVNRWGSAAALAAMLALGITTTCLVGCGSKSHSEAQVVASETGAHQSISPDVLAFDRLYVQNCAGCHGMTGADGSAVPLNNAMFLKLASNHMLKDVIANGRKGTLMPGFSDAEFGPLDHATPQGVKEPPGGRGKLTDRQIEKMIRGMREKWQTTVPNARNLPPLEVQTDKNGKLIGNVQAGKKLFHALYANSWLGKMSSKDWSWYLMLTSDQELRRLLITGWKRVGLPDYRHVRKGKALTDAQINDLVAYLASRRSSAESVYNPPQ